MPWMSRFSMIPAPMPRQASSPNPRSCLTKSLMSGLPVESRPGLRLFRGNCPRRPAIQEFIQAEAAGADDDQAQEDDAQGNGVGRYAHPLFGIVQVGCS